VEPRAGRFDRWVVPERGNRGKVQRVAHASGPDLGEATAAAECPRFDEARDQAGQGRRLAGAAIPLIKEFGDENRRGGFANPRDRREEVALCAQAGMAVEMVANQRLDTRDLRVETGDDGLHRRPDVGNRAAGREPIQFLGTQLLCRTLPSGRSNALTHFAFATSIPNTALSTCRSFRWRRVRSALCMQAGLE
jgi:hypothetical protein